MIDPTVFIVAAVLVVLTAIGVFASLWGKFLAQPTPEVPEKSAADLVAELAAQPPTRSRVADLFFEAEPAYEPPPVVIPQPAPKFTGAACTMAILDAEGRVLVSWQLKAG